MPILSGQETAHNSLDKVAPGVARCWNYKRNAKTPAETLAGSSSRVWWKCPICHREWEAVIKSRVRINGNACQKCSGKLRKPSFKQPTLEEAQHHLLSEWDYKRNAKEGMHPDNVTLGSRKLVHWICCRCPEGHLHRWRAEPLKRIRDVQSNQSPTGCPVCAGRQVCVCNSLQTVHPSIAAELDAKKNGFTSADVTASSHQMAWWHNDKRGSWEQSVNSRTGRKRLYQ